MEVCLPFLKLLRHELKMFSSTLYYPTVLFNKQLNVFDVIAWVQIQENIPLERNRGTFGLSAHPGKCWKPVCWIEANKEWIMDAILLRRLSERNGWRERARTGQRGRYILSCASQSDYVSADGHREAHTEGCKLYLQSLPLRSPAGRWEPPSPRCPGEDLSMETLFLFGVNFMHRTPIILYGFNRKGLK